jgi:hypothetical protein
MSRTVPSGKTVTEYSAGSLRVQSVGTLKAMLDLILSPSDDGPTLLVRTSSTRRFCCAAHDARKRTSNGKIDFMAGRLLFTNIARVKSRFSR